MRLLSVYNETYIKKSLTLPINWENGEIQS